MRAGQDVLILGVGGGVASHLSTGGFEDPGSESFRADELLAARNREARNKRSLPGTSGGLAETGCC